LKTALFPTILEDLLRTYFQHWIASPAMPNIFSDGEAYEVNNDYSIDLLYDKTRRVDFSHVSFLELGTIHCSFESASPESALNIADGALPPCPPAQSTQIYPQQWSEGAATASNSHAEASDKIHRREKARSVCQDEHKPEKLNTRKARCRATRAEGGETTASAEHQKTKVGRDLERNRHAAKRYRRKMQHSIKLLKDEEREKNMANFRLHCTIQVLREELINLKTECLRHRDCSCDEIRSYICREIPSVVRHP